MSLRRSKDLIARVLLLPLLLAVSSNVLAVSLGDELILSALGDPVEVEIGVLQWEDMDLDRVEISAASREEYAVFNLTWLPVLENLSFNLVGPDINGKVRVLVSSRDPLDEPFLELLLVLRWPGGSLRREYVLLFDPPGAPARALTVVVQEPPALEPEIPVVQPEPPPAVAVVIEAPEAEPVAEPEAEPEVADIPDARTTVAVEVETIAPQPAAAPPPADTSRRAYQVHSGESLWNIARQFRPAGVGENLYQVLLSIHNLNRSSFINGNISLLKANAVLQVPSVEDIERIDALTAQAEFERRWDQGTQRFEAAQRGEAIPLFADDAPAEEVAEVAEELPPGVEAPPVEDDKDALIMVSQTNVPQPLQIASASEAGASVADTSGSALAISPRIATRAFVTAELETEVAAMRARHESAEAVAQQLQATLDRARAERAASASIYGLENLLLAGSAVVLLGVLMAGLVATLRIASDLRSLRAGGSIALYPQTDSEWLAGRTSSRPQMYARREPLMPEMEVVELPGPDRGKPTKNS